MSAKMQADMAAAGVAVADSLSVNHCCNPSCGCEQVYVQLIDREGTLFAVAPISPEAAIQVADALCREAEHMLDLRDRRAGKVRQ